MSLSKPNIQTVSSRWPDELIEAVLLALLKEYDAGKDSVGAWEGPVVGSDGWKGAQAAFRLYECCKRMNRMLGPAEDSAGNLRVPGRIEDLAHASAATYAWTKVGEIAAHLDGAIKAATQVNAFAYQPESLHDYVVYRIDSIGSAFLEGLDYTQAKIQEIENGLRHTGCLVDGDRWVGNAASHVLELQRNLDQRRAEEEEAAFAAAIQAAAQQVADAAQPVPSDNSD